jgi:CRISPR/Cas system-associated exonuclease Cas4 (RecB family)
MKNTINMSSLAFLGVMLFTANTAIGQTTADSTSTSTPTSAGTVSQFNPDTIVVKTTTSADPVSYSYTKTTTYVDENGNAVSSETVKTGAPVTVYYDKNGDKMVATKVVVRKTTVVDPTAPMTQTTTTTSAGTISQFGPDAFVVKTTTSADPISYSSTKTTTYVDENGNPVSSETVKTGAPVTVYYTQDGTKMVATKVVVKKTTTTTTTTNPTP